VGKVRRRDADKSIELFFLGGGGGGGGGQEISNRNVLKRPSEIGVILEPMGWIVYLG